MTDTATATATPSGNGSAEVSLNYLTDGIEPSIDALHLFAQKIAERDEVIDAATGGRGELAVKNELAKNPDVQAVVAQVFASLQAQVFSQVQDPKNLVGFVHGLNQTFNSNYGEQMKKTVEGILEEEKKAASPVSEDALKTALAERSHLYKAFQALYEAFKMFGSDLSGVPEVKARRGSKGKRGANVWSKFQYYIDGTALAADATMTDVAKALGLDSAEDAKKAFENANIQVSVPQDGDKPAKIVKADRKNVPSEWSFSYGNKTVSAKAKDDYASDFAVSAVQSDDDDEEDETSDETA